jgi:hypothetical protein
MTQMTKAKALHALGLPHFAPQGDIRAAWRARVFALHPDRGGSPEELARVNAAYALLRDEPVRTRPSSAARPTARPEVKTRIERVTTEIRASCSDAIAAAGQADADYDPWSVQETAEHVPDTVRRRGRQVSYILARPLSPGTNRIAVPEPGCEGGRRRPPRIVTIECAGDGRGVYALPDLDRERLFPGTRRVRIHYGTGGG